MRELTIDEPDMVSGGYGGNEDEIVVTGYRPHPSQNWTTFSHTMRDYDLWLDINAAQTASELSGGGSASFSMYDYAGQETAANFDLSALYNSGQKFFSDHPNTFLTAGNGAFGLQVGLYYSDPTGLGFYVGVGSPAPSFALGRTSDANGFLTGASQHAQYGLGYGNSSTATAYSLGPPNASYTFGTNFSEVLDRLGKTVVDGFVIPSYNLSGRPFDYMDQ